MGILNSLGGAVSKGATSLWNDLTGAQVELFFKDSEQTSFDFGQKSAYYLDGQPRLKFQYFAKIKLNPLATDGNGDKFVDQYLNKDEVAMLVPLVRSVELPSMTMDTNMLNQYNHWRTSQTKIKFEPVTMEMHDVADGKTLRFWEMYYEYYFKDNFLDLSQLPKETAKDFDSSGSILDSGSAYLDSIVHGDSEESFGGESTPTDPKLSFVDGTPEYAQPNAYSEKFDPMHGFNLETVKNQKHLIDYVEIYQFHAGRWSVVHLVKPVISKFQHDTLSYEDTSDTAKMTFTFEYEYALYHNYYTLFDEDDTREKTGAKDYFKFSNGLEIDHPPNSSDFNIRKRRAGDAPALKEEFGTLPNESLLGNLVSDVSDILTTSPDKIGDAVVKGVTTGEWESPIDVESIKNSFKNKGVNGIQTISTKNLKATASGSSKAFVDFRRT